MGPAGWSAALALGLSTQVPRHETIAVPGRAPRNPDNVRFVSRAASAKRRDERLRPAEVALLEVLREWDTLVEVPAHDAIDRIYRAVSKAVREVDRLGCVACPRFVSTLSANDPGFGPTANYKGSRTGPEKCL